MKKLIDYLIDNSVAANLIMLIVIVGGIFTIPFIQKEMFPDANPDMIIVNVIYPQSSTEEVEELICIPIEEEIWDIEGIKKITSTSAEGAGSLTIELEDNANKIKVLDDIKTRIEAITTFPDDAEKPTISLLTVKELVINIAVYGDKSLEGLRKYAEKIRDDLLSVPYISQVFLTNAKNYEVSIEINQKKLRQYNINFAEIYSVLKNSSIDQTGGIIETGNKDLIVRAKRKAYTRPEFEKLPVKTLADGTKIYLKDVATVKDGFAHSNDEAYFNGKRTVMLNVFSVGKQDSLKIGNYVKEYVKKKKLSLPTGIHLGLYRDFTSYLKQRMELLIRNGTQGFIVVFIILALFLRLRLAFWVGAGIIFSFLGTFWLMPAMNVTVNMISLYAFILVLGIVVDDAIVVGESIFYYFDKEKTPKLAAIKGTEKVYVPVVFAVLTNVVAFVPLLFIPGFVGRFWKMIPLIVIPTFLFSLFESLFILPSHLAHIPRHKNSKFIWYRLQEGFEKRLLKFINYYYRNFLEICLKYRYIVLAVLIGFFILSVGFIAGGRIKIVYFPRIETDFIIVSFRLPPGSSAALTKNVAKYIEEKALKIKNEYKKQHNSEAIKLIYTSIASQPYMQEQRSFRGEASMGMYNNIGEVAIELVDSRKRSITTYEIENQLKKLVGEIPGIEEIKYTSAIAHQAPINIMLTGKDINQLKQAALDLEEKISKYKGTYNIEDSLKKGKQEIRVRLNPNGEALGFKLNDVAKFLRSAYYGIEVQTLHRNRDEVKVMVRSDLKERQNLKYLEDMLIKTNNNDFVPLYSICDISFYQGLETIKRAYRSRSVNVTASVDNTIANENEILQSVLKTALPELRQKYPEINYILEGQSQEQQDTLASMKKNMFLVLFFIYFLLAIPFRSYLQPLIVMTAIPFGIIGAVWAHYILGFDLSILSITGIVALSGVVVNDSLVLVDYVNQNRKKLASLKQAIVEAGLVRFRPVLLTSLTTIGGLTPILLEKSVQAQFLKPMTLALAGGVLFSTVITLILIPVLYNILEDMIKKFRKNGQKSDYNEK